MKKAAHSPFFFQHSASFVHAFKSKEIKKHKKIIFKNKFKKQRDSFQKQKDKHQKNTHDFFSPSQINFSSNRCKREEKRYGSIFFALTI